MNRKSMLPLCLLSMFGALACASDPKVDLGDGTNTGQLGERLSDYAAHWTGYAEAYQFADGSDLVRLSLDENGHGILEFGNSSPLAPLDPASPDVTGYGDLNGFSYPIAASVENARLRLSADEYEPYRAFCEAQAPIEMVDENNGGGTYYASAPIGGVVPLGDGNCHFISKWDIAEPTADVWNCEAIELSWMCECEASACPLGDLNQIQLDGSLEGAERFTGTLVVRSRLTSNPYDRVTVHLTKTE